MRSYQQWKKMQIDEDLGHSLIPPNIPRTQTGLIGNELRTDAGRISRERSGQTENRFDYFVKKLKSRISELPVPRFDQYQKGLGDLGMEIVGKTTFKNESQKDETATANHRHDARPNQKSSQ